MKTPIHSKGEEKQSSQKRSGAKIRKTRKFFWGSKKRTLLSFLSLLVLIGGVSAFFIFADPQVKSASFGWLQTDWSGGETENTATHENDQTGWTEFTEKDDNVDISTSGEITLSNSEGGSFSRGNTEDENFGDTIEDFDGIETENGALTFKKETGIMCQSDAECANEGTCVDGVCQGIDTLLTSFRTTVDNTNTYDFVIFDEQVDCGSIAYDDGDWLRVPSVAFYWDKVCNNPDINFNPSDLPSRLIYYNDPRYGSTSYANTKCEIVHLSEDSTSTNYQHTCYREVEVQPKD